MSWLTWEAIGHDLRLAPLAYCFASVAAWALTLVLLGVWLMRETGSRTASFVAVALVAQSPLVRETAWWYSSSSFSWAVSGILVAVLGAAGLGRRRGSLGLIALGVALAPAGTSLGILAAPLAMLRAFIEPGVSRRLKLSGRIGRDDGLTRVRPILQPGRIRIGQLHAASKLRRYSSPWRGSATRSACPAGCFGRRHSEYRHHGWRGRCRPRWFGGLVSCTLVATLFLVARSPSASRKAVLVGAAMIYCGYTLAYVPRVCMLRMGYWSELELLYHAVGRYHVLPLMGLAAILAAVIAACPLARRWTLWRGGRRSSARIVGLVMLAVQFAEASYWDFYLLPQDQKATFAALHRLGQLAREEGISRAQLVRIIDPVKRPWNEWLLIGRPASFPLVKLAVHAPRQVSHPLGDHEAPRPAQRSLDARERVALGADMCVSLNPARPGPGARTIWRLHGNTTCTRRTKSDQGGIATATSPAYVGFEFEPAPEARYLCCPASGLTRNSPFIWCDEKRRWRPGQGVRWLKSPANEAQAVIDLDRLIHLSVKPLSRIVIQFNGPGGELALEGPPRLLREKSAPGGRRQCPRCSALQNRQKDTQRSVDEVQRSGYILPIKLGRSTHDDGSRASGRCLRHSLVSLHHALRPPRVPARRRAGQPQGMDRTSAARTCGNLRGVRRRVLGDG